MARKSLESKIGDEVYAALVGDAYDSAERKEMNRRQSQKQQESEMKKSNGVKRQFVDGLTGAMQGGKRMPMMPKQGPDAGPQMEMGD